MQWLCTLQNDGGMRTEINKTTQCGWNNWRKNHRDVRRSIRQESTTTRIVKGKIHKMIVQPAML